MAQLVLVPGSSSSSCSCLGSGLLWALVVTWTVAGGGQLLQHPEQQQQPQGLLRVEVQPLNHPISCG